jgi:nitrite reductase/ring-hydroxylating ferredoxin subunit
MIIITVGRPERLSWSGAKRRRRQLVEPRIVVENREELIYLMSEASEIEHMLMLEYLFAALSLRTDASEGLTEEQLGAVRRWEGLILEVAAQEMLHLALWGNLLTAIGGAPHFDRPNFPQPVTYYPSGFQLALLPFSEQALGNFVFNERPDGMEYGAPELELARATMSFPITDVVVPHETQFTTQGDLYRAIEQGFERLVEKYGERRVFIGPPEAQATQRYFWWPELVPVTDLASAQAAIDTIVEQGEGARGDRHEAHFGKFLRVLVEYLEFKERDPAFEPARPVVAAWVRPPGQARLPDPTLITDPNTAGVADLFNASYEVMLQMLVRFFAHTEETEEELQTLSGTAVSAMSLLIKPLGQLLTTLPVGPEFPGKTAGPNFEYYRTGYLLPHRHAAWVLMHERLLELAHYCARLSGRPSAPAALTTIEVNLRKLAGTLERHIGRKAGDVGEDAGTPTSAFTAVLEEGELQGGAMRRVEVDGVPVVLSRSKSGEVCAIADTCTHMGAPLDAGDREGDVVMCPWHGSQFDLCSGEVLRGPASTPQQRFEARVRDGWVEVRPA